MFDGDRWYCDCMSWRFNHEHKGEKDADGRSVPRECKHTREAMFLMKTKGERAYKVIQPLGPWYEELQEYVANLVDLARNGKVSKAKFLAFRADLERFKQERENAAEAVASLDTMLSVYGSLLGQISQTV